MSLLRSAPSKTLSAFVVGVSPLESFDDFKTVGNRVSSVCRAEYWWSIDWSVRKLSLMLLNSAIIHLLLVDSNEISAVAWWAAITFASFLSVSLGPSAFNPSAVFTARGTLVDSLFVIWGLHLSMWSVPSVRRIALSLTVRNTMWSKWSYFLQMLLSLSVSAAALTLMSTFI